MIRVEVTSEADVARMKAAFRAVSALRDSDYEIWLVSVGPGGGGAMRCAWREGGLSGGSSQSNTTFISHGPGALGGFEGMGGGGGSGHSDVAVVTPGDGKKLAD